jgi:hypothetical protein
MKFLELATKMLTEINKPLSASEIWEFACAKGYANLLDTKGATPEYTLSARLYSALGDTSNNKFGAVGKRSKKFFSVFIRLTLGWLFIVFNRWDWGFGKFVQERVSDKISDQFNEEFYTRLSQYLSICISEKEPIVIKYYRRVLNRFRFELTLIAAITVMLFGHLILYILASVTTIDWTLTGVYLGIMISASTFLFIEAFKGVELFDELRKQIIDVCSDSTTSGISTLQSNR